MAADECQGLINLLIARGMMSATTDDVDERQAIPTELTDQWIQTDLNPKGSRRKRVDIGASLGILGHRREEFFEQAAAAHTLFAELFRGRLDPIAVIYDHLQSLSPGYRVVTAYEPDGRQYGPAIVRIHYGGFTYGPHFDSVRLREKRTDYAVYKYQHQFAGVLCLQNSTVDGQTAQGIIHNQLWNEGLDSCLKQGRFPELAAERNIASAQIDLEPGDLYFFNTHSIHEVPGVPADQPRVVLATFIGYSEDEAEIMVWS